jgi:hypothetical protein
MTDTQRRRIVASYREKETTDVRVLFCIGITQTFFDGDPKNIPTLIEGVTQAFSDLKGRFGINVLGTFDDDELMVGNSQSWPWTCYILADCPDLASVVNVCNIVRETEILGARLWKYMRIEARVGRKLFCGNE